MNFFRLRVINTLLLFAAGILLGFMFKEKFIPRHETAPAYSPRQAEPGEYRASAGTDVPEEEESLYPDEPYPPDPAVSADDEEAAEPQVSEVQRAVVMEVAQVPVIEPSAPRKAASGASADAFFSDPASFAGKTLELRLQMITAKKTASGWRLNLVHSSPAKRMEYLYVDDRKVLPDAPDLRIGYYYKVAFFCSAGSASAGNSLVSMAPTGEKTSWATGLSAVE